MSRSVAIHPSLQEALFQAFKPKHFPKEVRTTVALLDNAIARGEQLPLLSKENPDLNQAKAYEISAARCGVTIGRGLIPVGRKIGFTNKNMWSEYGVTEPNFGYVWKRTCYERRSEIRLPSSVMSLQPKIEPEIIFGLKSRPHSSMSDEEALSCVEWMAHGFEIVVSLFKDWKFTGADTTAANALHNRLYIGKKQVIDHTNSATILSNLANFEITLRKKNLRPRHGSGSNVLGSPIKALLHLCRILESQSLHPELCPGEIISTGTLTSAMPVRHGELWTTTLRGLDLPDLSMAIRHVRPVDREEERDVKELHRQEKNGTRSTRLSKYAREDEANAEDASSGEIELQSSKTSDDATESKKNVGKYRYRRTKTSEWREFQEWKKLKQQKDLDGKSEVAEEKGKA